MRLSPDGTKFATCSADKTVCIFDEEGTVVKHYKACHAMGINDLNWVDDNSFLTCSADNVVKKWSLDSDACVQEFTQDDHKREIPRQLLAVNSLGEEGVVAVSLNGDLCFWDKEGKFSSTQRHKDYVEQFCSFGKDIWYTSETFVYKISEDNSVSKVESSHDNKVDTITSNTWAVFTSGSDKKLIRYEDGKEVAKVTLNNKALVMAANETHVYVLCMHSDFVVLDAKDLSVKSQKKFTFDATAMDICNNTIWVGDKKGSLYVFDKESLEEIKSFANKHSKNVTVIASNG